MPARRKKRKPKKPEPEYYQMEIESWDASYSFGANLSKRIYSEEYFEHAYLFFNGQIVSPIIKQTNQARIMISFDQDLRDLWEQPPRQKRAKIVGSITLLTDDSRLEFIVWLPPQSQSLIAALATSGQAHYASVYGTKLRYRQGFVYNWNVSSYLEED